MLKTWVCVFCGRANDYKNNYCDYCTTISNINLSDKDLKFFKEFVGQEEIGVTDLDFEVYYPEPTDGI